MFTFDTNCKAIAGLKPNCKVMAGLYQKICKVFLGRHRVSVPVSTENAVEYLLHIHPRRERG